MNKQSDLPSHLQQTLQDLHSASRSSSAVVEELETQLLWPSEAVLHKADHARVDWELTCRWTAVGIVSGGVIEVEAICVFDLFLEPLLKAGSQPHIQSLDQVAASLGETIQADEIRGIVTNALKPQNMGITRDIQLVAYGNDEMTRTRSAELEGRRHVIFLRVQDELVQFSFASLMRGILGKEYRIDEDSFFGACFVPTIEFVRNEDFTRNYHWDDDIFHFAIEAAFVAKK